MATNWNQIGGSMDFGGAPSFDFSSPQGIQNSYQSAYNNASSMNRQMYGNIMGGYSSLLNNAQAGYGGLQKNVMRMLKGSNRANLQDIADRYTAFSGQQSQEMINRGLGNSTIQQSVQRGIQADHSKERTRSQGAFAQLQANYLSQIGLSRLSALTGIQQNQLGFMNSVQSPYPDAGMYASLASQMGGGGGGVGGMMPGGPGPHPGNRPIGGSQPSGLFNQGGSAYEPIGMGEGIWNYAGVSGGGQQQSPQSQVYAGWENGSSVGTYGGAMQEAEGYY